MNKESKTHHFPEDVEDALDNLDNYDLSKSVRGKFYEQYQALKGKAPVTIQTKDGEKKVVLHTIKTKAILDEQGNLKANLTSDLVSGEYEVTIILEETQIIT